MTTNNNNDNATANSNVPDNVKGCIQLDPYLRPFADVLSERRYLADEWNYKLTNGNSTSLTDFARNAYKEFGFHVNANNKDITFKEWAPNASRAFLIGDFNNWNESSHELKKDEYGNFEILLPPVKNAESGELQYAIPHDSKVKLLFILPDGSKIYRIPAWITRCTQPDEETVKQYGPGYEGRFWNPNMEIYKPTSANVAPTVGTSGLKIYEAHIGISTPEPKIGTYNEFTANVLPRIHDLGYNVVQLMAIMEHAYYGSFGYQVTNFFAVSSRYGTPDDLKKLIDAAHKLGISVFLDVVHSHASKNSGDGLNFFDGSDHQYFHSLQSSGGRGEHPLWDSRLFNYGKYEVQRFLLANLAFFIDVYKFDGFRFDGVTSMLYSHHGCGFGFSGDYNEYLSRDRSFVDHEALAYLMLANDLIHEMLPDSNTIAEDVSGYPTLCLPRSIGGGGFNYRLAMAIPDMWIKLLKECKDEDWEMGKIVYNLTNRRHGEKVVAYAESHDQALVGDKTLAFWLMDAAMYTDMTVLTSLTPVVDRGISLHKLIRLITHSLGGEAYLNFEGNEFGHPEWLDFPTQLNGQSYHYARRQFNLVDDRLLRYKDLYQFDKYLQHCESHYTWLNTPQAYVSLKHEVDKVIAYERNGLIFIFNFHPTQSFVDYRIGVEVPGAYKIILNSDRSEFGGHNRIDEAKSRFFTVDLPWNGRKNYIQVYIPSRVAIVLALENRV
ncbi:probable 1,4-alpha-glucan-branching enzyme [Saccharomycodes ludwigii]|uniref:1,4-alpha-glucan-branching enzyme n=1 Tax=Saccharomycodes ludwigii TaxID=36035 RepID=A0A376B785_9ASCO|nr:hypothetical protein SCDLUD_003517 [Saccharomycodes ludwigii]KAH3900530.1 hypothetical protein SCDLUD_003517 [Saccharomycodes ludwigii]SSD60491.1 probable 1,4-alpha-glucan-branching enzyme [Saccharomycodes ludwigii]